MDGEVSAAAEAFLFVLEIWGGAISLKALTQRARRKAPSFATAVVVELAYGAVGGWVGVAVATGMFPGVARWAR
jgi:hypothetical protein